MQEVIEPYGSIIERHLNNRGQGRNDYEMHPKHRESRYVVRMCFDLMKSIQVEGVASVTIDEVISAERMASGHVDYHRKAALYMDELARGIHPLQRWKAPKPHPAKTRTPSNTPD